MRQPIIRCSPLSVSRARGGRRSDAEAFGEAEEWLEGERGLETEAVEDVPGGLAITKVLGGDLGKVRGPAEDPIEQRPAAFGARQDSGDPVHPRLVALPLLVQIAGQVADDGAHSHSFGGASARRSNSGSASSSGSGRTWDLNQQRKR